MSLITGDYRKYIVEKYKFKKVKLNNWIVYDYYMLKLNDCDLLLTTHLCLSKNKKLIGVFDIDKLNDIEEILDKLIRKEKLRKICM
jgi:hypothetical protein